MDFTKIINDTITEPWGARKRDPHVFWPSEASMVVGDHIIGKCHRAAFYSCNGISATNPIDPKSIRKMEAGRAIEQNEHKFAEAAGILVGKNIKARKTYPDGLIISAEIDAVYAHEEQEFIIEIKSIGGYYARKSVFGGARTSGAPKEDHLLQTMLYLDIFPKYGEAIIRYIDRTDCDTMEYVISLFDLEGVTMLAVDGQPHPDFSLQRIMARYKSLDAYISSDTLPPRDYCIKYSAEQKRAINRTLKTKTTRVRDWQCSYCRFQSRCLKDG